MQIGRTHTAAPAAWPRRRWRAGLASLAAVLALSSLPVAAWTLPRAMPLPQEEVPSDESAAGDILADGRARVPDGDIAWTLRRLDVPGGDGLAIEQFPIGFALVDSGSVTLRAEDDDEPTELQDGEASILPDRKAGSLVGGADEPASLYEIALVSAEDAADEEEAAANEDAAVVGEPFPAPAGEAFEIALAGDTLTGEVEVTIPLSPSGAPTFYLTTDGTAQLQAGGQVVDLAAGQFALLTGEVQLRAAAGAPATYVVAAIGDEAEARERGDREERQAREERQREPRQRANQGSGGQTGASDGASRRAARQAARAGRQGQGQGGQGGRQGQPQSPGAPAPGVPDAGNPPPPGTPGAEPIPEPTLPTDPTVPGEGTPPAEEPPLAEEPPPADEPEVPEVPEDPAAPAEPPTPDPAAPVEPINPIVPEVPAVPGLPEVPAEETVVAESVPEEAPPVEEAPAAPVEEAPAPVEETPAADPAAEG